MPKQKQKRGIPITSFTLEQATVDTLDRHRGRYSRSAFVDVCLKEYFSSQGIEIIEDEE
ncbi:MAG: hypothetical protein WCS15_11320 [Prevotella sp.]